MKTIKYLFTLSALLLATFVSYSQNKIVEDTILVEGVCGMCKSRIEEAAFGKGVKFAEWTNETSKLALVYRSDKTSMEEIEARILAAGHSTENSKAAKEDHETLPDCCRYEELNKH
jgi:mercuric ion binding protein